MKKERLKDRYRVADYKFLVTALILSVILVTFSLVGYVNAVAVEGIQVLKISPKDGRAIVKIEDNSPQIIKKGDELVVQGSKFKVIEIVEGRVEFQTKSDENIEKVIFMINDGPDDRKQTISRIYREPGERPTFKKVRLSDNTISGGGNGR